MHALTMKSQSLAILQGIRKAHWKRGETALMTACYTGNKALMPWDALHR